MRLKDINDTVASTCKVRPNVVTAIQTETFKLLRAGIEKGEKVSIPGFGQFTVRDVPAQGEKPARKVIRFKLRTEEPNPKNDGKEKGARNKSKHEANAGATPGEGDNE